MPAATGKIWVNSGDSHITGAVALLAKLPEDIRERMPRSVKDEEAGFETIYIDGQVFKRELPKINPDRPRIGINAHPTDATADEFIERALGGNDPVKRIIDLDNEG